MRKKNKFFLTTIKGVGLIKFLLFSSVKDSKNDFKKINIHKVNYFFLPDILFLLQNLKHLIYGFFINKNELINISLEGNKIGRYLINDVYKYPGSFSNKLYFNLNFLIIFLKTSCKIFTIKYYLYFYNFKFIYLDHILYSNGALIDILKKKIIYTTSYPRHLTKILPNQTSQDNLKVTFSKKN